uniref:Uncharacterized protein n=1 Tax=Globodera rostochiensis TaxID=31243 RepID=A0A914HJ86_GLORO
MHHTWISKQGTKATAATGIRLVPLIVLFLPRCASAREAHKYCLKTRALSANKKEMLRSPVPLLVLFAIVVHIGRSLPYAKDGSLSSMTVNPPKALPNETTFSPEEIPGPTNFVPNDIFAWTKCGCANDSSIWTIIGATAFLFFSLLGALCVESNEKPGLNYGYAALMLFGYVGIFALIGVVDGIFALFGVVIRQSIWSTIGGFVILAFIIALSVIFWRRKELLLPNAAIAFLHILSGYVALLFVGIASYHGAACFNGHDRFILGGAFVCFAGMVVFSAAIAEIPQSFNIRKHLLPGLLGFVMIYGYVLIVYLGAVGNLSLVGIDGLYAAVLSVIFVLFCFVISSRK